MSTVETAVEELISEANQWRGRIALVQKLRQIGGIEKLAVQAQQKLDLLNAEIEARTCDANNAADKLIADARAEAGRIASETDAAKARLSSLDELISARSVELADLVAKLEEVKNDHAGISQLLATLRAKLR